MASKIATYQPRKIFGNLPSSFPLSNLIETQRKSFDWLLDEGISEILFEISPIEDFTGKNLALYLEDHSLGSPKYSVEEAIAKGVSYAAPLRVKARLLNKETGENMEQEVFLGDLPLMTDRGTFIINGIERVVVSQLTRSPGVFFTATIEPTTGRMLFAAELRPTRGSWLEFETGKNDVLSVKIDRKRKLAVTTFLRAIGLTTNEKMIETFKDVDTDDEHSFIQTTLLKDPTQTQEEALIEIYRKMRPGDPAILENARDLLHKMFFEPRRYSLGKVGRYKLNKRLGIDAPNDRDHWILSQDDVIGTIKELIRLNRQGGEPDDIDHLANRRVRAVGELVQNMLRVGLLQMERVARDRMSISAEPQLLTPSSLVNARPIIARMNEFFGGSQLSQFMDQDNSLSELAHLRRLSVMGPGGLSRERASFTVHDINHSQYGRLCPIETPEGPNVGLITHLALAARINEYGFIETPYKKIVAKGNRAQVTDTIEYLMADDEEKYQITHSAVNVDKTGLILDARVPLRRKGEFYEGPATDADYIDVVSWQVLGASAALIPFVAHDEANRALMGSNMMRQAVPLVRPAAPVIGTGMEEVVARNIGRVVLAPTDGVITYVDASRVEMKGKDGKKYEFPLRVFVRSNQNTSYTQRPLATVGQTVKTGDLLADGPTTDQGELALGQNLTVAYMSWDGYGYEDAIVISERLVREDILTSIHIEEHEATVVETKLGPEEITRDIPNVGEEALANLDEEGIVYVGAEVGPNDILVGKIAPKGETELTAEERLLRAIFGEKAKEVRDTSLRMPHGERGTVVDIQILDREKDDELDPGTLRIIKVKVAKMSKITVGDKLSGRHGNKGVISKVVPVEDMPYLADGTSVDIILPSVAVISRMNMGQLLETHLGLAASKAGYRAAIPGFGGFHEDEMISQLKEQGLPVDGKVELRDGRTGEAFEESIVVGTGYILKLKHMVDEKVHARSTGPYSLVTQQPLGGKAQMGGQRLGEMEVWALEAYGAANVLQEMLTIKSDDIVGRAKAIEAIIKGTDIPQATIPESFKVLVKELNGLNLDLDMIGAEIAVEKETDAELRQEEKDKQIGAEFAKELGAKETEMEGTGPGTEIIEEAEVKTEAAEPSTKELVEIEEDGNG